MKDYLIENTEFEREEEIMTRLYKGELTYYFFKINSIDFILSHSKVTDKYVLTDRTGMVLYAMGDDKKIKRALKKIKREGNV